MIVAVPDIRGKSPYIHQDNKVDRTKNFIKFEASMLHDVLPFVEKTYKVSPHREHRALAGFSVGAALARHIGIRHLDRFASISLLRGGIRLADGFEHTLQPLQLFSPSTSKTNKKNFSLVFAENYIVVSI